MADAVEAARQHVKEKAADELVGVERHGLAPVAAFDVVVLPFEGDVLLVEHDEPGVRDRDAVGVASEIGEDGLRSGERPLGVDDPFGAAQRRERGVEGALVCSGAKDRDLGSVSDDINKIVAELQKELKPGNTIQISSRSMTSMPVCNADRHDGAHQ